MARVFAETPEERALHSLTNVSADPEGNLTLTPSNSILDWAWNEKDAFGDPLGWKIGVPAVEDGITIFLSEVGKGTSTLTAQNTEPLPVERPSFVCSQAWNPGHAPATPMLAERSGLAPPQEPLRVEKAAVTVSGYAAGTYPVSYLLLDKRGAKTPPAPPVYVTFSQGGTATLDLTDIEIPVGTAKVAILMGLKGKGPATYNIQRRLNAANLRETYPLTGPYRTEGKPPSENETYVGQMDLDPRRVRIVDAARDLQPGIYEIRITGYTFAGESLPSEPVVVPVDRVHERSAIQVTLAEKAKRGLRGFRVYVFKDGAHHTAYDPSKGTSERVFGVNAKPRIYGYPEDAEVGNLRSEFAGRDLPQEDYSGIPAPTQELEPPVTKAGATALEPGRYRATWARTKAGFESRVGPIKEFVVAAAPGGGAAELVTLRPPHPLNEIPNAEFAEVDANDLPLGQTSVRGSGDISAADGTLTMDTVGARTTGDTPSHSVAYPVDRSADYELHARFEAEHDAGQFDAVLHEYDGEDATGAIVATTVLKSLSSDGAAGYRLPFGPWGQAWNSATVSAREIHRFVGATRHMRVRLHSWRSKKSKIGARKVLSSAGRYDPDPPRETPLSKTSYKAIAPAPKAGGTANPSAPTLLEVLGFKAAGGLPAGWKPVIKTGSSVGGIQAGAAVEGEFGYRFSKPTSAAGIHYAYRVWGTTRTTLADRSLVRFDALPTSQLVSLLSVKRTSGDLTSSTGHVGDLATVKVGANGGLVLYAIDPATGLSWTHRVPAVTVAPTDVLDAEIICRGGASAKGHVVLLLGKNGEARRFVAEIKGLDWRNHRPLTVVYGPHVVNDPAARFDFAFDTWINSDNGSPTSFAASAPPLEPMPEPDAPHEIGTRIETRVFATETSYASTLATDRSEIGVEWEATLTGLPTTETESSAIKGPLGEILARTVLDPLGRLYVEPVNAGGAVAERRMVAEGLAAGTKVRIETVLLGAGTAYGTLRAYVALGTGARRFLADMPGVDWTGLLVRGHGAGAGTLLDLDALRVTERGRVVFSEFAADGTPIEQAYLACLPGQPPSRELFLSGGRVAVRPGEARVRALKMRWAGVPGGKTWDLARVVAIRNDGERLYLGSLASAEGSSYWADRVLRYTVPPDCYLVECEPGETGEGEFVAQEPCDCPGTEPVREVTYPAQGSARVVYDTATPDADPALPLGRIWLALPVQADAPEGTSLTARYRSSEDLDGPFSPWRTDPSPAPQARHAHFDLSFVSSPDRRKTPVVRARSPRVEQLLIVGNAASRQLATLLRSDGSEFPGGTMVEGFGVVGSRKNYAIRQKNGRIRSNLVDEPSRGVGAFKVWFFTEEAMEEFEHVCLDPEGLIVEERGRSVRVRLGEQSEVQMMHSTAHLPDGADFAAGWHAVGTAQVSRCQVLEVAPIILPPGTPV